MKDINGKTISEKEFLENDIKVELPKLKKGQKCFKCKKEIKKNMGWIFNGFFWHILSISHLRLNAL